VGFLFLIFCLSRKSGIGISPSFLVIEEVGRGRGLVNRSTCYESLIWEALDLEPEEDLQITMKG